MIKITKIEPKQFTTAIRKRRVAAYCRVSTDSAEQISSLESQKEHYAKLIEKNPEWVFAGVYYDEGISGTSMAKRDGLNTMLKDCRDGRIDFIITKSISRFARNTEECLTTVRELYALKVYILFEKENINTETMDSSLMLSVLSSVAADESRSISENVRWGINKRFTDGTFVQGPVPYGYKTVDRKLTVYEPEAKYVRYIFEETLKGKGGRTIAKELNDMGVKPAKAKAWTSESVTRAIKNERYVGDVLYQKTYCENYQHKRNKDVLDKYYISDHHDPIVSRDVFEKANQMLKINREAKGIHEGSDKYQARYPFSGKIICGSCGVSWKRRTATATGYISWACSTHLDDKEKCTMKAIRNECFENAFATMMNKLIFSQKQLLRPYIDGLRGMNPGVNYAKVTSLETQISANLEAQNRLGTLFSKGYIEPALFTKESADLAAEAELLQSEKVNLSNCLNNNATYISEAKKLQAALSGLEMLDHFDGDLFTEYVDHITVIAADRIRFSLKCGLELEEEIGK